jgi:cold shock CspA family protein
MPGRIEACSARTPAPLESAVMKTPLSVSYRGVERFPDVDARVERWIEKLENLCRDTIEFRVAIEAPQGRGREQRPYRVRVIASVPGEDVRVGNNPPNAKRRGSLILAIDEAFRAVRRRLQDRVRLQRSEVKSHETKEPARVVRLVPEERHGFIRTADGRDLYFHANSVVNGAFEDLRRGSAVRYREEEGREGPQAANVVVDRGRRADLPPLRPTVRAVKRRTAARRRGR